jgi:hypothetical protein
MLFQWHQRTWLDGIVVAIFAVLMTIPVLQHGATFEDRAALWFAYTAIGAVFIAIVDGSTPLAQFESPMKLAVLALCGLSAWLDIARAWAVLPGGTMVEGSRWASFALLLILAHSVAHSRRGKVAVVAFVGGIATILTLNLAFHVIGTGLNDQRESGWLGYWNATAICAGLNALVATELQLSRRVAGRLIAGPLALASGIALTATVSRGAALAALIALGWFVSVSRNRLQSFGAVLATILIALIPIVRPELGVGSSVIAIGIAAVLITAASQFIAVHLGQPIVRWKHLKFAVGVLVLLALITALFTAGRIGGSLNDRVDRFRTGSIVDRRSSERLISGGASTRWDWWREAFDLWKRHPLQGWGGQAFSARSNAVPTDGTVYTAMRPHNQVLQVMEEGGIFALGLGLAAVIGIGMALWRARREPYAALLGGCAIAIGVQSLVDWTLSVPAVAALGAASAGAAGCRWAVPRLATRCSRRIQVPALTVLVVIACLPAVGVLLSRSAQDELVAGNAVRAESLSQISFALLPRATTVATTVEAQVAQGDLKIAKATLRNRMNDVKSDPSATLLRAALEAQLADR